MSSAARELNPAQERPFRGSSLYRENMGRLSIALSQLEDADTSASNPYPEDSEPDALARTDADEAEDRVPSRDATEDEAAAETADEEAVRKEPAEIKREEVQRLLNTRDSRTSDMRMRELLQYALDESYDRVKFSVPQQLIDYLPADLGKWTVNNRAKAIALGGKNREQKYTEIADLIDDTKAYQGSSWLDRAIKIGKMSPFNPEAMAVEIAVRMILRDAERERQIIER